MCQVENDLEDLVPSKKLKNSVPIIESDISGESEPEESESDSSAGSSASESD